MKKIYFKNLNEYFEQEITIEGFVDNIRNLQYVQFLVVRDTTGKVQVTIEKNEENSKLNELVSNLTAESTVKITGTLLKNEKVKLNGMEIIPKSIIVTSKCLEDLPINYKDSKSALLDTRLNYRFLDLRSEKNILMFKVQTCMVNAMRDFLVKGNFIEIHTPKIIGAASESGAEVFEMNYFNRKPKAHNFINKWLCVAVLKKYLKSHLHLEQKILTHIDMLQISHRSILN